LKSVKAGKKASETQIPVVGHQIEILHKKNKTETKAYLNSLCLFFAF
jgi:hypothetical protein